MGVRVAHYLLFHDGWEHRSPRCNSVGTAKPTFKVLLRSQCGLRSSVGLYPFVWWPGELSKLQRSLQKEPRTVGKWPLSGVFEEHSSALPSPFSYPCPLSPVLISTKWCFVLVLWVAPLASFL